MFVELLKFFEWVGFGMDEGSIIGLFIVFVEGGDFDEFIVDVVCGILDGYIVMECSIVEWGCYLVINVLKFVLWMMLDCNF